MFPFYPARLRHTAALSCARTLYYSWIPSSNVNNQKRRNRAETHWNWNKPRSQPTPISSMDRTLFRVIVTRFLPNRHSLPPLRMPAALAPGIRLRALPLASCRTAPWHRRPGAPILSRRHPLQIPPSQFRGSCQCVGSLVSYNSRCALLPTVTSSHLIARG